jgi:hypothetical protein
MFVSDVGTVSFDLKNTSGPMKAVGGGPSFAFVLSVGYLRFQVALGQMAEPSVLDAKDPSYCIYSEQERLPAFLRCLMKDFRYRDVYKG